MKNYDRLIVNCAERLVRKLHTGEFYTLNGEYSKEVKEEIQRMKKHCAAADEQKKDNE